VGINTIFNKEGATLIRYRKLLAKASRSGNICPLLVDVGKAEHVQSASDNDAEFTQTGNSEHVQVKVDSREGGI